MGMEYGRIGARFFRPCFVLLMLCMGLWSQQASAMDLARLAREPVWLGLLHFDTESQRGEVTDPRFYLAPNGRQNPLAELQATITALSLPAQSDDETHARCRFPARAMWLDRELSRPLPAVSCPRLEAWVNLAELQSISLMLVSGYFGNPASSFGHSLLRMNTRSASSTRGLLDISVNFGAAVPENEPTVVYVLRGLFGGYVSGFSDRYYYTHDQVYTRTESRDVWEYELVLSPWQQQMLVLHLRELLGMEFQYYFLSKNCSYRQAELLALVLGEDFVTDVSLWYAPVELFQRLHDLDRSAPGHLVKAVRYWPSAQRSLHERFDALPPDMQSRLNQQLRAERFDPNPWAEASAEQQVLALDFLLEYVDYRMAALEGEALEPWQQRKNAVLRQRLAWPPGTAADPPRQARPSPAAGMRTSRIYADFGRSDRGEGVAAIGYTAFHQDLLAQSDLSGSGLVLGDVQLGGGRNGSWALHQFDVLKLDKLAPPLSALAVDLEPAWRLRFGAQRESRRCDECLEWFAEGGWGRSWEVLPNLAFSGLLLGRLGSRGLAPQLGAELNLLYLRRGLGALLRVSRLQDFKFARPSTRVAASLAYPLSGQWAMRLEFEQQADASLSLRLQRSF